jgi:hypothetical protein
MMRFVALDHFGVSAWRLMGISLSGSIGAAVLTWTLFGEALGAARTPTALVVAVLVLYILLSSPRRLLDGERVVQARESMVLSAAAMACLKVTGSRSKTLVTLRPRDPTLASALTEAGRRVLLGDLVQNAVSGISRSLASYSAGAALMNVANASPGDFDIGDDEAMGLAVSSELNRETKLPIFMTVCFFLPIMLILYAVFTHTYDPEVLAELGALEFVAIDFAFYLGANDRRPQ